MLLVNPLLDSLADVIVDGGAVDWDTARATADADAQAVIAQMRLLATVADVHRDNVPRQWGHLRIVERVGRGSFGVVYRAYDTRLDREVALKLMPGGRDDDASASTIIREGRLLAKIQHPNVVTIHGAERLGGRVGLWMEFVRGQSLDQLARASGRFKRADAVAIGTKLCEAVAAVHAAGLLHRDIKAQNVMRADDGRIVLMDFGTGREADEAGASDLTGTPLYLAPEVLAGQQATRQSDIYSLGVLLFFLLAGTYPVRGSSVGDLLRAHEQGARLTLRSARPDLPRSLSRAIDRAIHVQPELRHGSVEAFGADLRRTASPWRRRSLIATAAAGIVISSLWWGAPRSGPAPVDTVTANQMPVIAVLPFRNDGSAETDLFVEGLTYELERSLSVIDGVVVKSASLAAAGNKARQPETIRGQLGANLVLDGSVRRAGDALRVYVRLVRVDGDVLVWSNRFDRRFDDVFTIQDEISLAIVNALRLKLGRGQRRYDTNPRVYERYLKARALLRRTDAAHEAIPIFNEVVAADPNFAPAYAGIASAMAAKTYMFPNVDPTNISPEIANATIRPAASRAIELDPLLAEAHAAMGLVYSSELDWSAAEQAFRQALSLDPGQTQVHADFVLSTLWPLGRLHESRDLLRQAVERDPLSPFLWRLYGRMQSLTGAFAESLESLKTAAEIDPAFELGFLVEEAMVFDGRAREAIAIMEQRGEVVYGILGYAYAISGRRADAEALAARSAGFPQRQVLIFAGLGDADRAFDALDRLAATNPRRALCYTSYRELDALRADSRMAAFRLRYGVR